LKNAGFECVGFQDGPSALEFLSTELVDVVITDVTMPGMDGLELCERMKLDARTADIPVLFLTANTETEDKVRGLEIGGHDYLSKPVDQQELVARTHAALRVKQLQDELKRKFELQREVNRLHQGMLSEHWQKTFGQLAASLAHEINNPLAVALGSVQLLDLEQSLSDEVHSRLKVIDQSLQRAAGKLRSLLLIAQNKREPQSVHLGRLVEDLLTLINYRVVIQKVNVQTRIHNQCDWKGVPADLGRALLYIIDNAIEAAESVSQSSMTVVVEREGPDCCIRVVDNGPGIPDDIRDRIFDPFFTTKGSPHSGIGLFLAEDLVRRIGGRIECRTPSPLGSTEFTLFLPAFSRQAIFT